MSKLACLVALLICLPLIAPGLALGDAGSTMAAYQALRGAQPDGRTLAVESLTLERDVFEIRFGTGTFHLLEAVDGKTPGAVFLGRGSYSLKPGSGIERHHLAVLGGLEGRQSFDDTFSSALLLFDDNSEAELVAAGSAASGSPDRAAVDLVESKRSGMLAGAPADPHLRLLRSRLNDEGLDGGPFFALVDGELVPDAVIAVDQMGILDGEGSCLMAESVGQPRFWYSDRLVVDDGRRAPGPRPLVDVHHYRIDSRVVRGDGLEGETRIRFEVLVPELQVLPIDLFPTLEIQRAELEGAESPATFLQPGAGPSAAIFLPRPLSRGAKAELRIAYSGDGLIVDEGTDIYQVKGRTNWYPNLGAFSDRALYDLRFRVPKGNQVISVGEQVSSKEEGGETVSVWKSEHPLTVAGFNYGDFRLFEQTEENTGVAIEVYATKGEPDFVTELNRMLQSAGEGLSFREQLEVAGNDAYNGAALNNYTVSNSIGISTSSLAEAAMADGVNSVQVFTQLFGPLDSKRLAVTQQSDWSFGQSWPSLVYLPYMMGVSSVLNVGLGIDGYAGFADQVGIHEIAHQWWGHHVGWATYRDQWLSEGFAEFSTALVLELTKGPKAYDAFWEQRRLAVLGRSEGALLAPYAAGSLTLGYRAGGVQSPGAGSDLMYSKGAFILQMLRAMMRDQKESSDQRFFDMLRDFADTYKGQNPSTADFKAHVEKHMIPELNAGGNGKIDWFFDQWVYGTEVPTYTADVQVEKLGKKKYRLHGTLTQSGVSEDFVALVPTYVDFGKEEYGQFGRAPFKGNMTHKLDVTLELPRKPRAVKMNARHEVLAFDG